MADRSKSHFPILEALQGQKADRFRFHVPAHSVLPGEYWGRYDLTELPGLDHLFAPRGCISKAQALAAGAFRAGSTFFLVNGSSSGLIAAIYTQCRPGDTLILGRNSHRSAAAGLIISGAKPRFITVGEGPAGIPWNVLPADLEKAVISAEAKIQGVLITSPNYWGICTDLSAMAKVTRECGAPLIVDEAHGGHFIFHHGLPAGAATSGADLWVNSGHKTLGALTPGAYLHLREGSPVNVWKLEEALAMLQSSSPPYPVLLSLDLARGWLQDYGQSAFESALDNASKLRKSITQSAVFQCLEQEQLPPGLQLDSLRLTIYWEKLPLTGYRLSKLLHDEYRIETEMADVAYLVALIHPGLAEEAVKALTWALREIEQRFGAAGRIRPPEPYPLPALAMSPREAMELESRPVPLVEAAGCIAAQLLTPFPPGVPVLYPGEEIAPETIERVLKDLRDGVHIQELSTASRPLLRVVSS